MTDISRQIDLGGNDVIVNSIFVGATGPGQAGSSLNVTDLTSVTPGTAAASKAVVLDSSKGIATITSATITTLTSTTANMTTANVTNVTSPTNLALNGTSTGTIAIGNVSTGAVTVTPALGVSSTITGTSASASALAIGLAGATNPAFVVDASTGSQAAGLSVKGAVTGGTVAVAAIDSGGATNLTVNAKGTGTIGIGSVSTGAVTITPATTITGAVTPTGGVAAAGGYSVSPRNMHTGGNPPSVSTDFTDYTVVTTETIRAEIFVPANISSTGVAVFNGSAVAGNLTLYLIDSTGTQVAATASTAQSGTDAYQRIAWTGGPIAVKGPATYWVAAQGNNTGGKINTHTIGNFGADKQTGTTYGTLTVAASPTTFTTALGPVATLY